MTDLIFLLAPAVAFLIVALGILTILSLIWTGFYLIGKRLIANVWGTEMFFKFIWDEVRKKRDENEISNHKGN